MLERCYFNSCIHTHLMAFQNSQLHFESHRNGGGGEQQTSSFPSSDSPKVWSSSNYSQNSRVRGNLSTASYIPQMWKNGVISGYLWERRLSPAIIPTHSWLDHSLLLTFEHCECLNNQLIAQAFKSDSQFAEDNDWAVQFEIVCREPQYWWALSGHLTDNNDHRCISHGKQILKAPKVNYSSPNK